MLRNLILRNWLIYIYIKLTICMLFAQMSDELKDSWIGFVTVVERLVLLDVNKLELWDYGMYSSFIHAFMVMCI